MLVSKVSVLDFHCFQCPTDSSTLSEHFRQVRSHIKDPQTSSCSIGSDKYFDSVSFWKNAYTQAEDAQSKLTDRIYDLEQHVESLKLKLNHATIEEVVQGSAKRKAGDDMDASSSTRKRQKTSSGPKTHISIVSGTDKLEDLMANLNCEESCMFPNRRRVMHSHV